MRDGELESAGGSGSAARGTLSSPHQVGERAHGLAETPRPDARRVESSVLRAAAPIMHGHRGICLRVVASYLYYLAIALLHTKHGWG